jgi:hypothetical protein
MLELLNVDISLHFLMMLVSREHDASEKGACTFPLYDEEQEKSQEHGPPQLSGGCLSYSHYGHHSVRTELSSDSVIHRFPSIITQVSGSPVQLAAEMKHSLKRLLG